MSKVNSFDTPDTQPKPRPKSAVKQKIFKPWLAGSPGKKKPGLQTGQPFTPSNEKQQTINGKLYSYRSILADIRRHSYWRCGYAAFVGGKLVFSYQAFPRN